MAEFLDSIEVCSDCGGLLRRGEAPPGPVLEYRELVTIYETTNQIQAHLIRGLLEQNDVPVYISGESLQGALGELPPTMPFIRVQVPIEQAGWARELIEGQRGSPE
jgi:hypothetical protein